MRKMNKKAVLSICAMLITAGAFTGGYVVKAAGTPYYDAVLNYTPDANRGTGSFQVGYHSGTQTASGLYAVATGFNSTASGTYAVAMGNMAQATNESAIAMGSTANASGFGSVAIGSGTSATVLGAVAIGNGAAATGASSFAAGYNSQAKGMASVAIGNTSIANGENSTALGGGMTSSSAKNSFALGSGASATVSDSVALGSGAVASTTSGKSGYLASGDTSATWVSTKNAVSIGDAANGVTRQITGVAAGTADTDVTNVAQLKAVDNKVEMANSNISSLNNEVANVNNNIIGLNNSVNQLGTKINHVGASAAALSALHPLDFDPDDKWNFAAGYGNYSGANAVAVGAFYRPNEDTMFSVGGSFSSGENMLNAGISLKFGQKNNVSKSRIAMGKEIKELKGEIETLKSAILELNAGRNIDLSKMTLFPDVPENHWAYQAISVLAGNDILQGYPDGKFSGDRQMTRYEFASIVYREALKGKQISEKLLREFASEIEYFRIATVSKDKSGNPTIERVRVIR